MLKLIQLYVNVVYILHYMKLSEGNCFFPFRVMKILLQITNMTWASQMKSIVYASFFLSFSLSFSQINQFFFPFESKILLLLAKKSNSMRNQNNTLTSRQFIHFRICIIHLTLSEFIVIYVGTLNWSPFSSIFSNTHHKHNNIKWWLMK